jgi:hypothetical protein
VVYRIYGGASPGSAGAGYRSHPSTRKEGGGSCGIAELQTWGQKITTGSVIKYICGQSSLFPVNKALNSSWKPQPERKSGREAKPGDQ